jgi:hypothetical protein
LLGGILNETIARVTDILGDELNVFLDRLAEGGAAPRRIPWYGGGKDRAREAVAAAKIA